ncbi:WbqC family protein [Epilithonimonas sp.]|uniref:WbqC family protein n=1 Tax=Epilithonimonas sp. TaxID=2894511 RepID=UPI0035B0193D
MKNSILLPIFYLPPISWFSIFLDEDNHISLEQFENFPKQTYRNRAAIYGANGKLPLIIPIKHNGKREMRDIEISYSEDWQKLHWKSIKTAYQSTPYFEFYEDRLQSIYDEKISSLLEFDLKTIKVILQILKTEKDFQLTEEYIKQPEAQDLREQFSAKSESNYQMEDYYQSFSDKYGFIKDLSILDLLCNIGPESMTYIKNIKLS